MYRDITRFSYNAQALPDTIVDPRGHRTSFTYDAGRVSTTTEHDVGVWVSETTPDSIQDLTWQFGYETALGNLATVTTPLGNVTQYAYDAAGQLTQAVSPTGDSTFYAYSPRGRMDSVWFAIEDRHDRFRMRYDDEGNRIAVYDPRDVPRFWTYDNAGRQATMTDEFGRVERRLFDAASNLVKTIDRQGDSIWSEYSARNLETTRYSGEVRYDAGEEEVYGGISSWITPGTVLIRQEISTFGYDAAGRMTSGKNRQTRLAMEYTLEGAIRADSQALVLPSSHTMAFDYEYFPSGVRKRLEQKRDGTVRIVSDSVGAGALIERYSVDGSVIDFRYDALRRRSEVTYPNGIVFRYRYDGDGRLRLAEATMSGTELARFHYTDYDAAGRPLRMTESGNHLEASQVDTHIWDYDDRGQVVYEQVQSAFNPGAVQYFYDPSGNRTLQLNCAREITCDHRIEYVVGQQDNRIDRRIEQAPTDTLESDYRYDWNGRLVLQIDSTNDEGGVVTILKPRFHNPLGRLIDAEVVNVRSATDSAWFAYDVLGRRIKGPSPWRMPIRSTTGPT